MKNYLLFFALLWLYSVHSNGQTPQRVKSGTNMGLGASDITGVSINGKLVIATSSKLYVTDGTDAGTVQMPHVIDPRGLVKAGNRAFFIGFGNTKGYELWITDGTINGTTMVRDINPSGSAFSTTTCSGAENWLVVMNNDVYFSADDGINGAELWKSDGTVAGTVMVKDINPYGSSMDYTPCGTQMERGNWGVAVSNKLYFTADDSTHGYELWESDGTAAGTHLFMDVYNGPYGATPHMYYPFGNRFCFSTGGNIYISDGTVAGTTQLAYSVTPQPDYAVVDDTLYFMGNTFSSGSSDLFDIWRTDGTSSGTYSIAQNFRMEYFAPLSNRRFQLTAHKKQLYFVARDQQQANSGIWKSDGHSLGATRLHGGSIGKLVTAGDKLYFKARDSASQRADLWYTNGTPAGTVKINYPPGVTGTQGPVFSAMLALNGVYVLNDSIYYTMMYDSLVGPDLYRIGLFPLAVPELTQDGDVRIYPNPARTVLTVAGVEVSRVEVYNITGILQQKQVGSNTIDVSGLAPGQYFLHITTRDDRQLTERFVKY